MNEIFIGEVCSNDCCIFPTNAGIYEVPERDTETISIYGRSGDLTHDNGRYKNIDIVYPCAVYRNFNENFMAFRSKVMKNHKYAKIQESFEPDRFRMGRIKSFSNLSYSVDSKIGTFEMTFDCMPQWWLKSGEDSITFTENSEIFNPTDFPSQPKIRVYGYGKVYINDNYIDVLEAGTEFIDIDCMKMDAVENEKNMNGKINVSNWEDIVIESGYNKIAFGDTVTKLEIIPRWYTI